MEFLNYILEKFEIAFQKHEKEVVIELAIDRILTFIGVHVILGLAGLFKVSEVVGTTFNLLGDNIACYPSKTNSTADRSLMIHAQKFCWESTEHYSYDYTDITNEKDALLDDAIAVKFLFKSLPYLFIGEAVLLALPAIYWDISVGPRLTGLLKFMLHFLDDVYNSLKKIPAGTYRKKPYDKEGNYLDGWRRFRPRYKEEHQGMTTERPNYNKKTTSAVNHLEAPGEIVKKLIDREYSEDEDSDEEQFAATTQRHYKKSRNMPLGDITDRQIFSMLCFENFASLSYQPYIVAVEALTSTKSAEGHRRGVVPMKKGILAQLCHKENFSGKYLAKCYMMRYTFNILLSSILVSQSWAIFFVFFMPTFTTKVFPCLIPANGATLLCVINKHWDITALYLIKALLLTAYLILSIYQFVFVRFGSNRGMCYFFEDIADSSSVALLSADRAEKDLGQ